MEPYTFKLSSLLIRSSLSVFIELLICSAGQNSIIIVSGANLLLSEKDVMDAEPVIKGCRVLLCQLEISSSTTLAALKLAKKHNGALIF